MKPSSTRHDNRRPDELRPSLDLEDVLQNAPKRTGTLFQVPRVIE